MINNLLRTFGYFDLNGLKYSSAHLRSIEDSIPFWSRVNQAKYVDVITKKQCDQQRPAAIFFNDSILPVPGVASQILNADLDTWFLKNKPNATAVGNIAYMALYANDERVGKIANLMLEKYRKYCAEKKDTTVF